MLTEEMEGAENPHPDPPSEPQETPTNPNPSMLGRSGLIDRTQFIRIIIQAIYSLGFKKAASSLESESGVQLHSPEYKSLMPHIKSGRLEDFIAAFNKIDNLPERTQSMTSFLFWREHFLELLRSRNGMSALEVLTNNILPLEVDRWMVERLACCLIYKEDQQRSDLLEEQPRLLPPWLQVPSGRLVHLVEMAVLKQRASCIYHYYSDVTTSLYEDCCRYDQILFKTVQETPTNPNPSRLGRSGLIDRTQFIRIIIQAIYSLGFKKAASSLESESGVQLHSPEYKSLMPHIKSGILEDFIAAFNKIDNLPERTQSMTSFLFWREHFLELLRSRNDMSALEVLRNNILPLEVDRRMVERLACCLIYKEDQQRSDLLEEQPRLLPPWLQVPNGRLVHLVDMAVLKQRASCIYHYDSDVATSLYEDCCRSDQILFKTVQILSEHKSKVLFVQFSNKGEYLASSSTECTAIIWRVNEDNTLSFKHALEGPFSCVKWSPDDTMLLSCFVDKELQLWDVDTGRSKLRFGFKSSYFITSFTWFPDSRKVICGYNMQGNCIYMYDLQGNERKVWKWENMRFATHIAVTPDERHLVIVNIFGLILIHDFKKETEVEISESRLITSLSLSRDGRFLIVNLDIGEIHLWALDGHMINPWCYIGHKQTKHSSAGFQLEYGSNVIGSCFGGLDCSFIASGSEDSKVYIWQRDYRKVIQFLEGHLMAVNWVSWNPAKPRMLASASDDGTIRIWLASRESEGISTGAESSVSPQD